MINRLAVGIRGNLVAWLALFVALGGTSLAASHYVINSTKQINPKVIKKLKGNRGPRGAIGPTGATGAQGPAGTPNTASFFSRTESDGRYLGKGAQAADSAKLGGNSAGAFTAGSGGQAGKWQELIGGQAEPSFMAIPGIGELSVECDTSTPATNVALTAETPLVFATADAIPNGKVSEMQSLALKAGQLIVTTFAKPEHGTGETIIQASTVAAEPTDNFA